ncbi:peroxisome biogenesis factor 1, putative [Eimeria necatrix]|uniref:Peroxisome biogenesis factor 1, putative n=1 Tax=Eimeria necatrix TaxID=51315 RepID=U6MQU4_9EIME|nr:peroxisome biogenesis factor 1, putative [Eimeria necatrix]CDJ64854.1 peroxisome biogenesis factor 1, putative [Eimeria necatrix]
MVVPHLEQHQQQRRQEQQQTVPVSSHHVGIIVPLPSLQSCFVRLSGPPSASSLWQQQRHFCRVLQLQQLLPRQQGISPGSQALSAEAEAPARSLAEAAKLVGAPQLYVGWIGAGLGPADAGAVKEATAEAAAAGTRLDDVVYIGVATALCSLLGLAKGERVVVAAVDVDQLEQQQQQQQHLKGPFLPSVEVAPLSREDWDAVQLHAEALEDQVLQQLAVCTPGRPFPLWVGGSSKPVFLRVCTPQLETQDEDELERGPPQKPLRGPLGRPPFILLSQNTELHVRPLAQAAFRRGSPSEVEGVEGDKIKRDILRVLPMPDELVEESCMQERSPGPLLGVFEGPESSRSCCSCCCGKDASRKQPAWPYICLLHPLHVKALQQQQQWLLPALRSRQPRKEAEGTVPSRTERAQQQRRLTQSIAAAESLALVCVRGAAAAESPHAGICGWQGGHAMMLAAAAAAVPLGCLRLPAFVRRLYGWALSSRVCVESCVQLPTLPSCLLLTPLVSSSVHLPLRETEERDKHRERERHCCMGPSSNPRDALTAALIQTEQGRRKLLETFLTLPDKNAADDRTLAAAVAGTAANVGSAASAAAAELRTNSSEATEGQESLQLAVSAFASLLGLALWDGAVVRLSVDLSKEDIKRISNRTAGREAPVELHQQKEQQTSEYANGTNWTSTCVLSADASPFAAIATEQKVKEGLVGTSLGQTSRRPSDFSFREELQDLEEGLGDLYASSDLEPAQCGGVAVGAVTAQPHEDSSSHRRREDGDKQTKLLEPAEPAGPSARRQVTSWPVGEPPTLAHLSHLCSIVEEISLEGARGAEPVEDGFSSACSNTKSIVARPESTNGETMAEPSDRASSPQACCEVTEDPDVVHVIVDVVVSFNAENTKDKASLFLPSLETEAAPQRLSPQFNQDMPLVLAALYRSHFHPRQMPLTPDVGCVLLSSALRNLVLEGGLAAEVTSPLVVPSGAGDAKEHMHSICLPLRFMRTPTANGIPWALEQPSDTSKEGPEKMGHCEVSGGGLAVDAHTARNTSGVIEAAQRLWWLAPPSAFVQPPSAVLSAESSDSGAETQLLRLLQQGCVEVPSAEVHFCLCNFKGGSRLNPLDQLLSVGCSIGPFMRDFNMLNAFGAQPAALSRTGKSLRVKRDV